MSRTSRRVLGARGARNAGSTGVGYLCRCRATPRLARPAAPGAAGTRGRPPGCRGDDRERDSERSACPSRRCGKWRPTSHLH
eukprot:6402892-Pyramimonas_sp.AAC.1